MPTEMPRVPFGAVYYRKSNPPPEDWARDYRVAAADGLNAFRHWFMWSAIERRPGVYDWDECDRQLDLAAENGIATIVAEFTMAAPDWFQRQHARHRQIRSDGRPMESGYSPSCAVAGFGDGLAGAGALTLNAPEVHAAVMEFLTVLARRYRGHPGLMGYDVNNEVNFQPDYDFSEATAAAFRVWLREKYGDLDTLGEAWRRYGCAEWDDVVPPRFVKPYPECLDWMQFRRDNFYGHVADKIATLRAADPEARIISHGIAGGISAMARHGCDDWRAASQVEIYGYTWVAARKGNEAWRNFYGGDLVRGAARGKPFWHAERQGGPLWMQPQVLGRDRDDARVADAEDVRLWSLASFAAGARGMMNLRYRPLLDGPLWGAFGSYAMDGSRTERSDMAGEIARWLNAPAQAEVMDARPVRGEIGLLVVPETQDWDALIGHEGGFRTYTEAMWGAYRGFFDQGIQPDWVHSDDIDGCRVLYAPYPIMWPEDLARRIEAWVRGGGMLISEACPAYFGDRGRVGTSQPNYGLDAVFGATEAGVEFMPDIAGRDRIRLEGREVRCGGFRQVYAPTTGRELGRFATSERGVAIVENDCDAGRTLLIGSHVSAAHHAEGATPPNAAWFAYCLDWAGIAPRVRSSNPTLVCRLHEGGPGRYLWIVNPSRAVQIATIAVDERPVAGTALWGGPIEGDRVTVGGRDAVIVRLAE